MSHLIDPDSEAGAAHHLSHVADSASSKIKMIVPLLTPITADKRVLAPRTMSLSLAKPLMTFIRAGTILGVHPGTKVFKKGEKFFAGEGAERRFVPRLALDVQVDDKAAVELGLTRIAAAIQEELLSTGIAKHRVLIPDLNNFKPLISNCNKLVQDIVLAESESDMSSFAALKWKSEHPTEDDAKTGAPIFHMRDAAGKWSAIHPTEDRLVGPQDLLVPGVRFTVGLSIAKVTPVAKADAWVLAPTVTSVFIEASAEKVFSMVDEEEMVPTPVFSVEEALPVVPTIEEFDVDAVAKSALEADVPTVGGGKRKAERKGRIMGVTKRSKTTAGVADES